MKGMAIPGFVYVDADSVIKETFFEEHDYARYTANNLISKLFPELAEAAGKSVKAPHVGLKLAQSDVAVLPGSRVTLTAQVSLPPDVHVYAPGVKEYKPVALELKPVPEAILRQVRYPQSKMLLLPAINQTVPVFEVNFKITQDVRVSYDMKFIMAVMKGSASGKMITLSGDLLYQACNATICYRPSGVPVSWGLTVKQLDQERSSEAIQHKD